MDDNKLRDILYRHAVAGRDIGQGLASDYVSQFLAVEADLEKEIAARYARIEANGFDRGPKTTAHLNDMLKAVREVRQKVYEKAAAGLVADLEKLGKIETRFAANAMKSAGGSVDLSTVIPNNAFIKNLILTTPLASRDGEGTLLMPWLQFHEAGTMKRLEDAVRLGAFEGQSTAQVVGRIIGTRDIPGILETSRRDATTIALTANGAIQNSARLETFKRMKSIKFVEWSAILDSRTSQKCQQLSGQIWAIDEPHPQPPAHPRCRSILIPRRDRDGNKHKPFGEWLRDQPEAVQDDVLGKARADIFRANPDFDFANYFREGGGYKSLAELRAFDDRLFGEGGVKSPRKAPAPAPKPDPAPEPRQRFSTPINPDVNAATIEVRSTRTIKKELTARMVENAADSRYINRAIIRGVKDTDFGKAALPTALSDEAASTLAALLPETDAIADAFNIPRLRGIRTITATKRAIMDMGDGSLGINAVYINGFVGDVGEGGTKGLQAAYDKLKAQMDALGEEIATTKARYEAEGRVGAFYAEYGAKFREYQALSKKAFEAKRKLARATNIGAKAVSTWKVGDPVRPDPISRTTADRPFNAEGYFDGIDKFRLVLFHEMAHHVHDFFNNRFGWANRAGVPPVIDELAKRFRKFATSKGSASFERAKHFPSDYAMTNHVEWWAENFGLYMMGRKDLVEPELAALIEEMIDYAAKQRTD